MGVHREPLGHADGLAHLLAIGFSDRHPIPHPYAHTQRQSDQQSHLDAERQSDFLGRACFERLPSRTCASSGSCLFGTEADIRLDLATNVHEFHAKGAGVSRRQ